MQQLIYNYGLFSPNVRLKNAMPVQHRTLYMKMCVCLIVAGEINFRLMHYCATLNTFVQLTVTGSSTKLTEGIVVFPLQQWLGESFAMLRYKYISYIVVHTVGNSCEKKTDIKKITFTSPLKPIFVLRLQNDLILLSE